MHDAENVEFKFSRLRRHLDTVNEHGKATTFLGIGAKGPHYMTVMLHTHTYWSGSQGERKR